MACLIFARTALAATVVLVMTAGAIGSDQARLDVANLVLPFPPEVPPPASSGNREAPRVLPVDPTTTASLGPVVRPPPALEPAPAAMTQALQAYASGALAQGDEAARALPPGLWRSSAEWAALRTFPREAGYSRIMAFLAAHPGWASHAWLEKRAEEALFGDNIPADVIRAAFAEVTPQTPAGKLALARTLLESGDTRGATALASDVWRRDDISPALEKIVLGEFGPLLARADHKFRADRLLYKESVPAALRAATLAGPDVLALARARAAVINEAASDALFAAVPASLAKDPGLTFSTIQKLRRADRIEAAATIMLDAPRDAAALVNGDEWWTERRMLARAMLDRGDGEMAWRLCAEHSATGANARVEAEFHAGWIALRFLDDPVRARVHFARLAQWAEGPGTQARAAYWLARTQEMLGDNEGANAFFARAARHPTFFYGQLAQARIGSGELSLRSLPVAAAGGDRAESTRVAEALLGAGAKEIATSLMYDIARNAGDETQVAALAGVIASSHDARLSLQIGKIASQRGVALDELAYPDFGVPEFVPLPGSVDKTMVYSIVRQESAFQASASSGAGAKGLMQMMVATARNTAQKAGVSFDAARLTSDAAFNTQLGASHLGTLLGEHRGSYVLTFAAYNAGGARVKEWINAYGDPRKPEIDVVDWIELIPITETRQYVQHILENLQVYRVRIGQQPRLMIEADLHAHE